MKRFLCLSVFFYCTLAAAGNHTTFTDTSVNTTTNSSLELTAKEQTWLSEHPEISVGGGPDWAPFDFVNDNGQYSGIANDYLNLIAEKTGLKFKVSIDKWSNQLQKIRDKKIDLLGSAYHTKAREQYVNYSTPYVEVLDYFFIRDDLDVKTLADLDGKRAAIPEKYAHGELLKKHFPKINIITVNNFSDAIDAVLENRADMLFDAYATIAYVLKKEGISTIIPFKSTRNIGTNPIHIITRKDAPELASIVQKGLDAITDQEKTLIYNRWLGIKSKEKKQKLDLTTTEQQWLQQHKIIRFTGDPHWLPYEAFDEQGNYTGIVAEHLKLIEKKLGIKVEIITTNSWKESVEKVKRGEIDVLSETTASDLSSLLTFTHHYLSSPVVIVMRSDEGYVENISQLKQKQIKIAAIEGYGYISEIIKHHPELELTWVNAVQEGLTAVSTGRVDALLATLAQASYHISELGINNIRIIGKTEFNTKLAFGMQPDFAPLVPLFDRAIASISQSEKRHILDKWGKQKFATKVDYVLLSQIATVLLLIISVIAYWNRRLAKEMILRKEVEAQTLALIETIPLQIIITSFEGIILSANPQARKDYKVKEDEISHLHISDFYYDVNDRDKVFEELSKNGKVDQKIVPFKKTDGEVCSMMVSIIPINYNKQKAFLTIAVDMTERIQLEQALKMSKQTAEESSHFKSQFLANMSHEIRTPMNAVIGLSHLALNTNLDKQQRDYLEKIKSSGQNLLTIINDILDFSKIEAGKLEIENTGFLLDSLLDNLVSMMALQAEEKNLEIIFKRDLNIPNTLIGDPLRLSQILLNLAQNAIKFTDSGEIIIAVQLHKRRKNRLYLEFSVSDTGIGIDEKQLKHLFDAFVQADSSTTRQYGGTGLGLSISQQLVNLMGGKLQAQSALGKGSKFSFTLNLAAQTNTPAQTFDSVVALKGLRVLLIDDNQTSRQTLAEMLSSFSFDVSTAVSAKQAYSLIEEADDKPQSQLQTFDLVLVDVYMPDTDGITVAQHIRNNTQLQKQPLILLIASYAHENIITQVDENGLDGFLIKPTSPSTLFNTINEIFHNNEKKPEKIKPTSQAFKGKVLLVEDNAINQQVAKEMLENLGLLVVIADNGEKAIWQIQQAEYDVVFMDIQMPGIDGFETTRRIRKKLQNSRLPIIAMTAHAMSGDRERCLEAGMNDYLSKPIDPEALCQSLKPWIESINNNKQTITKNTIPENNTIDWNTDIPGINLKQGLSLIANNVNLYLQLLQDFLDKYGDTPQLLNQYLDSGNLEEAHSLMHTLSGVTGTIGAQALQEKVHHMSNILQNNTLIETEVLTSFSNTFIETTHNLETWLNRENVAVANTINQNITQDIKLDDEVLARITLLLQEGKPEAFKLLTRINQQQLDNKKAELISLALDHAQMYDFSSALSSLSKLNP